MFTKKSVNDWDISGKRVLLRADYNVPVDQGVIVDDYRIKQSLPTIRLILERAGSLIIVSHLGRPDGQANPALSLRPVSKRLSELLEKEVHFAADCVGEKVQKAAEGLEPGGVLVLENVRFHPEEEKNDQAFAKEIVKATGAEIFVQDGFGVVHRAHATTDAIAKLLPAVAGPLLEKEVDTITNVMQSPQRPLLAIVGGAKISDKIDILNRLIEIADSVAVAGAMANNFLLASDISVGKSLVEVEKEVLTTAQQILQKARSAEQSRKFSFLVPVDAVVSTAIDGTKPTRVVDLSSNSLADIEAYPRVPPLSAHTLGADESIFDIGPISAGTIAGAVKLASTVVWNGTCGVTETKGLAGAADPFSHGTRLVMDAMIGDSNHHVNRPFTLVGGGDTAGYVESMGLAADFNHVSTGGGAFLELMSGKNLPGVEVLWNKDG